MSLDIVELVMTLEELTGLGADGFDPETTLGDLHWRLVQQERAKAHPRRSSDKIWSTLADLLEEHGVPPVQISPRTRVVDLLLG